MATAIVVGGGVGGLAAALGLRKAGWEASVVERAPEFTAIGAGITLWPNALRSLEELGLGERLAPLLAARASGSLHDRRGRELSHVDGAAVERRFGRPMVGLHRAQLLDLLRSGVPDDWLRAGSEVVSVTRTGEVRFGDGRVEHADLVVGADGIHSRVRASLWPAHAATRAAGYTAFRAVVEANTAAAPGMTWLPGVECGVVPLADGRRYWYASLAEPRRYRSVRADSGERPGNRDPYAALRERTATAALPLRELIAGTPTESILRHELRVLRRPLPSYVAGRVALVGDAAHAMTPFLGQGGGQAIEDAVVLAASLSTGGGNLDAALARYDAARLPRSRRITTASALAGVVGNRLRNRSLIAVRDMAVRCMPDSAAVRQMDFAVGWIPPVIRAPSSS